MSVSHRKINEAGFAVVDLLVAIAVAGLAGSILVGLVTFVERSRAETTRRDREHEGAAIVERVLRTLLDSAPPFVPGVPLRSAVAGDEQELTVTSSGLPIISLPQAAAFRLRREAERSRSDVVLTWVDDKGREQRTLLAEGVSELTLAYLPLERDPSKGPTSRKATWRSQWRAGDGPLTALRLALRFGAASTPRVFVIPIEADLPAACLRNPRQTGCLLEGFG
ncbi:hypothetical protein [Microvirga brassicacearum]|uniref:Prepilin-type N-terminal cleavage/methylation domain-containing protein n=1 Tax=Microvirga brassicacearum TaxID=2580413 RepID=A0A5N3P4M9_9HYPH|nr:hypothetical protein [Microvirga brassicacearum]KAB0264674.1 hypothetical protein FEZ63_21725 [Microvirga brassicacearum]